MRAFRSSMFASPFALFLSIATVSGSLTALTGCTQGGPESDSESDNVSPATLSAALSDSDGSTVTLKNTSGEVVFTQNVTLDGLTVSEEPGGVLSFNISGVSYRLVENTDLGGGLWRMAVEMPTGERVSVTMREGANAGTALHPNIAQAVAIALIAGAVVVIVALVSFWSLSSCLDHLRVTQAACFARTPGNWQWSGRCSGGSWRDGWQYNAESTCSLVDPKPTNGPPPMPEGVGMPAANPAPEGE